jgi:hypothetical protein
MSTGKRWDVKRDGRYMPILGGYQLDMENHGHLVSTPVPSRNQLAVGCRVGYNEINLPEYKGTVVAAGKFEHGADCQVKWDQYDFNSAECSFNLRSL